MSDAKREDGMSLIVKTAARWLKPFILLFGVYIVLYGHLTPGGGFAGGVVVACAFILLTLAYGQVTASRILRTGIASELDSVGALIFLVVAVLGLFTVNVFFGNFIETTEGAQFRLLSGGVIPICNVGIGLKVGMSLFLVFAMLSALHVGVRNGVRQILRRGKD
jgi:multicomponent Na+:H+ antiporter subunit B